MQRKPLPHRKVVFVCVNQRGEGERVCCANGGGQELRDRLKAMVKERKLQGKIRVCQSGCMDRCEDGPNMMVFPDNVWLCGVKAEDLEGILEDLARGLENRSTELGGERQR